MSQVPIIAIVDDDESVRLATESLMRSFGFRTNIFASAESFLNSSTLPDTDCLITDVQMPNMGGLELHEVLRARGAALPVIFMTAFPEEQVRRRAQEVRAVGFLAKPFDGDAIMSLVFEALKNPSQAP
ncbi:response regulator transcription factor [Ancylobacter pratisalsi]|uniref:response regulator transcription factor n=1 Tax=Ancylobacter pratisalsi TaxID=1745854 RepID=UPI001FEC259B|nr:response regulator [Ancylobacter pratisalsi]